MAVIIGGDGRGSHADCDPDDAVADLSESDDDCWICGEELPVEAEALPSDHDSYYCDRCGGYHAGLSADCDEG